MNVKRELKELVKGWGCWLAAGWLAADDWHGRGFGDIVSLVVFGSVTAACLYSTIGFLVRLAHAAVHRRETVAVDS
ncbi:hypothetical protein ACFY7C_36530 [Streptomyces sp. NPDC012769]|uniref:hypothetical protein n=1 Tax=Streptomyces sp. NPDC012769 TaxID=3364848 RepID=UPI0036891C78